MWIRELLLAVVGLSSGLMVSAGVFALIATAKILPCLAEKTHTAQYSMLYESCVVFGGILGNLISVYHQAPPLGLVGVGVFGLFTGIFVGCLSVALAEILNVIPIMVRRIQLSTGAAWVMLSMAVGKMAGSLLFFLTMGR